MDTDSRMDHMSNSKTMKCDVPDRPAVHLPVDQADSELDREFEELAQLLLEVYLWKLQQERQNPGDVKVDNSPPPATI